MDYPVPAGMKGSSMFLSGVTDEMRQVYREQIFQVSKQDLVDVTAKLVNLVCDEQDTLVVVCNQIMKSTWNMRNPHAIVHLRC